MDTSLDKSALKRNASLQAQRWLVLVGVVLFLVKVIAWFITDSVAILTDALESTVNVIAGFVGLYSLGLAAKPRDENHPYGHGKAEFLSAAIEGTLIVVAGLIIVYESVTRYMNPHEIHSLDYGILLIAFTAIVNYLMGAYCIRIGQKNNSLALVASGSHLKTDTYSTFGLIIGLGLMLLTKYTLLDSLVAITFAFYIIYTGIRIIRISISGMMDESDYLITKEISKVLQEHRKANQVDIHNLKIINYGGFFHIDCHLTVPWYYDVNEAHCVLDDVTEVLKNHFEDEVEFFVHTDGCIETQCVICPVSECPHRKNPFQERLEWSVKNLTKNARHVFEKQASF